MDHDAFSVNYNDSATNGAGTIWEAAYALPVRVTKEDFQDWSQPRFVCFLGAPINDRACESHARWGELPLNLPFPLLPSVPVPH